MAQAAPHAISRWNNVHTIPALSFHGEKQPQGRPIYALIHPFYSQHAGFEEAMRRFPEEMGNAQREAHIAEESEHMAGAWRDSLADFAREPGALLLFITEQRQVNTPEAGLLNDAKERFGEKNVIVASLAWEIEVAGNEVVRRIKGAAATLLAFGEYTSRCVVVNAMKIAEAMGLEHEDVFVLRELSVDAGKPTRIAKINGKKEYFFNYKDMFGDPLSPAVRARIGLMPEHQRSAVIESNLKYFEVTFSDRIDEEMAREKGLSRR